jgi:tyrosyl-tRNA synthetase
MSISDELMWSYYDLVTDFAEPVIVRLKEEVRTAALHPMAAKMQLAHNVIAGFHGEAAAKQAADEFQRVFREKKAPSVAAEYHFLAVGRGGAIFLQKRKGDVESSVPCGDLIQNGKEKWSKLLVLLREAPSKSEADRLIKQRAVEIDGQPMTDVAAEITFDKPANFAVRVGKKSFFQVFVE